MTNCTLFIWIITGIFGSGFIIIPLSFLFKNMSKGIYKKMNKPRKIQGGPQFPAMEFIPQKNVPFFPRMEFRFPRIDKIPQFAYGLIIFALIVIGYVKYIPWGNIKPCPKSKTTEQAFFQKPPVDSTGHYIYHN